MKGLENKLYEIAKDVLIKRFPKGWGGVTLALTENENVLMGLYLDGYNSRLKECMEKSVVKEAEKLDEKITHLLIMVRENHRSDFKLLKPCGRCVEELRARLGKTLRYMVEEDQKIVYKEF